MKTAGEPDSAPARIEWLIFRGRNGYEAVIFAGPVWAFSLCSVMKLYLSKLSALRGQKVGLFVTQAFKKPWLGGNKAIRQMTKVCADKGGAIVKTGIVNWNSPQREEQIAALIKDFAGI